MERGVVDTDDLLRLALALLVVWLALQVVESVLDIVFGRLFLLLRPFLLLVVLVLVAYFLYDRR